MRAPVRRLADMYTRTIEAKHYIKFLERMLSAVDELRTEVRATATSRRLLEQQQQLSSPQQQSPQSAWAEDPVSVEPFEVWATIDGCQPPGAPKALAPSMAPAPSKPRKGKKRRR